MVDRGQSPQGQEHSPPATKHCSVFSLLAQVFSFPNCICNLEHVGTVLMNLGKGGPMLSSRQHWTYVGWERSLGRSLATLWLLLLTVCQHLFLREDFLLRLQIREASHLQPRSHPSSFWGIRTRALLGCPDRTGSCHFSWGMCLTHSWESLGTSVGSSCQASHQLDRKQKSGFRRSPSPWKPCPLDIFLSAPVSKPASCDSLIGERKTGQGEAGKGERHRGRRRIPPGRRRLPWDEWGEHDRWAERLRRGRSWPSLVLWRALAGWRETGSTCPRCLLPQLPPSPASVCTGHWGTMRWAGGWGLDGSGCEGKAVEPST